MTRSDDIRDEDLLSYLDGVLDQEKTEYLDSRLATDHDLANRLEQMNAPLDQVRTDMAALAAQAPKPPVAPINIARSDKAGFSSTQFRLAAMASAAALCAGLYIGASFFAPKTENLADWRMDVANYQALYVAQTLALPTPSESQAMSALSEIGSQIERDLTGFHNVPGLVFKRAQILGRQGEPLIQLAYVDTDGNPFAICFLPLSQPDAQLNAQVRHGLASADWVSNGVGVLVIGGQDQEFVTRAAQAVQSAI